jgi:phage tail-like protein
MQSGLGMALGLAERLGAHVDPYLAHSFHVEIGGIVVAGFSSVDGLSSRMEVQTVREGGSLHERHLPHQIVCSNLTLSGGLIAWDPLWKWYGETIAGKIKRRNGSIYLINPVGVPVAWWNFYNAYPIAFEGPSFDAGQSAIATQRFTLAHEGIVKSGASSWVAAAMSLTDALSSASSVIGNAKGAFGAASGLAKGGINGVLGGLL